ncbi:MAG: amino acid permease [Pseudonocardiaceae bacterium]
MAVEQGLQQGLQQRHLTMIAIGGVVGASLFVGSSALLASAGPAASVTYAITAIGIVFVMRMLGEMAVANPATSSFAGYARAAFGRWAGFCTGWLYWYFWAIVVGYEAVVGGKLLQYWIDLPSWLMGGLLLVAMLASNLVSVRNYGEFEYWLSAVKVTAIVAFLAIGIAFAAGLWPSREADLSNLVAHGGFAPHGWGVVFSGIVVAVFSMVGAEIATIAAGESAEPERAIARATNSVIVRSGLFYAGSALVLSLVVPWDKITVGQSPFVDALDVVGIPGGADIMNFVVLIAVLSCLNSGLYTCSRMLFTLAASGDAPPRAAAVSKRGVPRIALLACAAVAVLCIILDYFTPETAFLFLLNTSGATIMIVYLMIALSQIRLRRRYEREAPERLTLKMWLFPYLSVLTALAIIALLVSMFFQDSSRDQIALSLLATVVIALAYPARKMFRRDRDDSDTESPRRIPADT